MVLHSPDISKYLTSATVPEFAANYTPEAKKAAEEARKIDVYKMPELDDGVRREIARAIPVAVIVTHSSSLHNIDGCDTNEN